MIRPRSGVTLAAGDFLGFRLATASINDCVREVVDWIDEGRDGRYFACLNPHSVMVAQQSVRFRVSLTNADLIIPDGIGVVWGGRTLGLSVTERVTGADMFLGVCRELNARGGGKFFFLGSTPETLAMLREKVELTFPKIDVVGTYAPPFRKEFTPDDTSAMIDIVNAAKPNVLWVGMTAPKQETWIHTNRSALRVPLIGPIGAVFDFAAGRVQRSSPMFQRLGLEWLPRLIREPRRLWRRTLISAPRFIVRVAAARVLGTAGEHTQK